MRSRIVTNIKVLSTSPEVLAHDRRTRVSEHRSTKTTFNKKAHAQQQKAFIDMSTANKVDASIRRDERKQSNKARYDKRK